jgi:pyruvate, orthophosphate dikinase
MFFEGDRIDAMREMILADNEGRPQSRPGQAAALSARRLRSASLKNSKACPQPSACSTHLCTSSCPTTAEQQAARKKAWHHRREDGAPRGSELHEFNPMLGHRGCRLGIAYPEITAMQARAIFEAAADVAKKKIKVKPEVMIPLVGFKEGTRPADRNRPSCRRKKSWQNKRSSSVISSAP